MRTVTSWGVARRAASRFVAGETVADALRAVETLNRRGIQATLDFLGESTRSLAEAGAASQEIIHLLEAIQSAGLRANVSIKLSQIGLSLDPQTARAHLLNILTRARELDNFIRIDMEDTSLTTPTLDLFFDMRRSGFENVGIVLQAYLYRTRADLGRVLAGGGRVRLCKGAYQEPAQLAFPAKADVDQNYDLLVLDLLRGAEACGAPLLSENGRTPPIPAIASHDERRIDFALRSVEELKLPRAAVEFQMLYGIRRDLQEKLAAQGYPVRVYVPYGTHWYPYFMRRLAERPANLWFFVSNFFRR